MGVCKDGLIQNNKAYNVWKAGPYQDTFDSESLTVEYNDFQNVIIGANWNLHKRNILNGEYAVGAVLFRKNLIKLAATRQQSYGIVVGLIDSDKISIKNFRLEDNTITWFKKRGKGFAAHLKSVDNLQLIKNDMELGNGTYIIGKNPTEVLEHKGEIITV